jgi:hypothetical protein
MSQERRCRACKAPIPPHSHAGRPRIYCTACVPPGTEARASAAWRAVNPERVEAYNAARRRGCSVPEPSLTTVAKRKESEHVWS